MSARFHRAVSRIVVPAVTVLAFMTGAQPVLGGTCIPTQAAFPPGHWAARGIVVSSVDSDDLSTQVIAASGGFDLTVDQFGGVSGTFSLAGNGYAQSWREHDDSAATARYTKTGELGGTASRIEITGQTEVEIEGVVDIAPGRDGDSLDPGGQDLYAFGNTFSLPFTAAFSPSAASCTAVFGSLGGPVEYGTDTEGSESYFMAVRIGPGARAADVQGQLAALLEHGEIVLNMDPVDTDIVARFVLDMLQFESLLASLESCDPASELDMGPAWAMLRSVLLNTVRTFLDAARNEAYTSREIVRTLGLWLQGGSLGWREADCLAVNEFNDDALALTTRFEDVLIDRFMAATQANETSETALIAAAAYQYGLPRLIAAVEGN
jgi:hypothetical protein